MLGARQSARHIRIFRSHGHFSTLSRPAQTQDYGVTADLALQTENIADLSQRTLNTATPPNHLPVRAYRIITRGIFEEGFVRHHQHR